MNRSRNTLPGTQQERKLARINRSDDQQALEKLILAYQKAVAENDKTTIDSCFEAICRQYQPQNYQPEWYKQYSHLYDDRDDFEADYMRVFCVVLKAWVPRERRKESRYGGSGEFKNFFWGSLQHHYINLVKSMASGKRNASIQCPICQTWCNSLSTHVMQSHAHLLWDHMKSEGFDIKTSKDCPFCDSYKAPSKCAIAENEPGYAEALQAKQSESLRKHIVSKHSTFIFEVFHTLYPEHSTAFTKPMSVHVGDDEHESNLYDSVSHESPLNQLLSTDLSPIQRQIIVEVMNGELNITYSAIYDCTMEEFEYELDGLRDMMNLFGLEG